MGGVLYVCVSVRVLYGERRHFSLRATVAFIKIADTVSPSVRPSIHPRDTPFIAASVIPSIHPPTYHRGTNPSAVSPFPPSFSYSTPPAWPSHLDHSTHTMCLSHLTVLDLLVSIFALLHFVDRLECGWRPPQPRADYIDVGPARVEMVIQRRSEGMPLRRWEGMPLALRVLGIPRSMVQRGNGWRRAGKHRCDDAGGRKGPRGVDDRKLLSTLDLKSGRQEHGGMLHINRWPLLHHHALHHRHRHRPWHYLVN